MKINAKKKLAAFCLSFLTAACAPSSGGGEKIQSSSDDIKFVAVKDIRVSDSNVNSAEPSIAAARDGSVFLVWVEHGANKNADIFLQRFDSDGNKIGEKTPVDPPNLRATAWFGDAPTVKIGGDGKIYVGWTAKVDAPQGRPTDLYLSVSRDGGATFAAPVKVNDDSKPASHGMHSLAVDGENRVYLAWLDERNLKPIEKAESAGDDSSMRGFHFVKIHHNSNRQSADDKPAEKEEASEPNSEIFYAVSSGGGVTFAPNVKLAGETCPCCKTNLLAAPENRVFVSWRQVLGGDFRHIAVASIANGGKKFSTTIVSDDRWEINACPVSGAPMALGENNQLEIAWFTAGKAGKPGLYRAASGDDGKTFSPRALTFEGGVAGTPVFLTNENRVADVVLESGGELFHLEQTAGGANDFKLFADGSLPAAVFAGKKLFVAFTRKAGENGTVWLTEF